MAAKHRPHWVSRIFFCHILNLRFLVVIGFFICAYWYLCVRQFLVVIGFIFVVIGFYICVSGTLSALNYLSTKIAMSFGAKREDELKNEK